MTAAHVPRHDLDAEAAVLSAALLDATALDRVRGNLQPDAFYSPAHRRVWEAVCHLSDHAQPVDVLTVASWLKSRDRLTEVGGTAWLARLVDAAPSVANVEAYATTITTAALQRRVVAECQRAAAEGYGDVGDVRAWVGSLEERLAGLTSGAAERKAAFLGDVVRDAFEQARDGSKSKRVLTGLRSLDESVSCHSGDLVIIAARPGMGKTALVGGVAVTLGLTETSEEHQAGLMFSAEMDRIQIAQRLLAGDASVPVSALRHANVSDEAWTRLTESAQKLDGCALVLDDKPAPKLAHIRSVIRETKRNLDRWPTGTDKPRKLRLVIVDYIQIMGTDVAKGKNREQEISELSRGLKEIARTEDVVMVALSQLNRGVEQRANKRPLLSDLRESGAIEQDADAIVFVYRDEYYNPGGPKGVAELLIAKNRSGSTGRAFVKFQGAFTLFSDLSVSEEEQLRRESKEDLQMTNDHHQTARAIALELLKTDTADNDETVRVSVSILGAMTVKLAHLKGQVDDLHRANSKLEERARAAEKSAREAGGGAPSTAFAVIDDLAQQRDEARAALSKACNERDGAIFKLNAAKADADAERSAMRAELASVTASRDALANACAVPVELARLYRVSKRALATYGRPIQISKVAEESGEFVAEVCKEMHRTSEERIDIELHDLLTSALSLCKPALMAKAAERLEGRLVK